MVGTHHVGSLDAWLDCHYNSEGVSIPAFGAVTCHVQGRSRCSLLATGTRTSLAAPCKAGLQAHSYLGVSGTESAGGGVSECAWSSRQRTSDVSSFPPLAASDSLSVGRESAHSALSPKMSARPAAGLAKRPSLLSRQLRFAASDSCYSSSDPGVSHSSFDEVGSLDSGISTSSGPRRSISSPSAPLQPGTTAPSPSLPTSTASPAAADETPATTSTNSPPPTRPPVDQSVAMDTTTTTTTTSAAGCSMHTAPTPHGDAGLSTQNSSACQISDDYVYGMFGGSSSTHSGSIGDLCSSGSNALPSKDCGTPTSEPLPMLLLMSLTSEKAAAATSTATATAAVVCVGGGGDGDIAGSSGSSTSTSQGRSMYSGDEADGTERRRSSCVPAATRTGSRCNAASLVTNKALSSPPRNAASSLAACNASEPACSSPPRNAASSLAACNASEPACSSSPSSAAAAAAVAACSLDVSASQGTDTVHDKPSRTTASAVAVMVTAGRPASSESLPDPWDDPDPLPPLPLAPPVCAEDAEAAGVAGGVTAGVRVGTVCADEPAGCLQVLSGKRGIPYESLFPVEVVVEAGTPVGSSESASPFSTFNAAASARGNAGTGVNGESRVRGRYGCLGREGHHPLLSGLRHAVSLEPVKDEWTAGEGRSYDALERAMRHACSSVDSACSSGGACASRTGSIFSLLSAEIEPGMFEGTVRRGLPRRAGCSRAASQSVAPVSPLPPPSPQQEQQQQQEEEEDDLMGLLAVAESIVAAVR